MPMWGPGGSSKKKTTSDGVRLPRETGSSVKEEDKRVKDEDRESEAVDVTEKREVGKRRGLKLYREYTKEETAEYVSVIQDMEPLSEMEMVENLLKWGLPPSFVMGYYGVKDMEKDWTTEERFCVLMENIKEFVNEKVLVITNDEDEMRMMEFFVGHDQVFDIQSMDDLVNYLEQEGEMTLWFGMNLPEEILEDIDVIAETVSFISELNILSMGEYDLFNGALHIDSWEDLDYRGMKEEDISRDEIEENILKGVEDEEVHEEIDSEIPMLDEKKEREELGENEFDGDFVEEDDVEDRTELYGGREVVNEGETGSVTEDEVVSVMDEGDEVENKIKELEKEMNRLVEVMEEREIEYEAVDDVLYGKNKRIEELTKELKDMEEKLNKAQETYQHYVSSRLTEKEEEELREKIEELKEKKSGLESTVELMRKEVKKAHVEKRVTEKSFEDLKEKYQSLSSGNVSNQFEIKTLKESDSQTVVYFKVWNQPPYFKSFMESFVKLLKEFFNLKTLIIKEPGEIAEKYFQGWEQVNNFNEGKSDRLWLAPNRFMFEGWESYVEGLDYVIVIDFISGEDRLIKGEGVFPVQVMIDEKEKEILGVKGIVLSGGESSAVDMRYDPVYEKAPTKLVRNTYMDMKVKKWMKSSGLF